MARRHLAHAWARYSVKFADTDIHNDRWNDLPGWDPISPAIVRTIPQEYVGLDRVLQRWAVSVSGGIQTEIWDDSGVARPPPLDENHAYIVDRVVCKLKRRQERLLTYWYRKNIGIRQIKKKLHIRTSEDMYEELTDALRVVSSRVRASDSLSLISLMEMHHESSVSEV